VKVDVHKKRVCVQDMIESHVLEQDARRSIMRSVRDLKLPDGMKKPASRAGVFCTIKETENNVIKKHANNDDARELWWHIRALARLLVKEAFDVGFRCRGQHTLDLETTSIFLFTAARP
jgi:hypothetical protein